MRLDWSKTGEEERKALYRVTKAILDREGIAWPDFFEAHLQPPLHRSLTYANGNFSKGRVSWKIAHQIHQWIVANHSDFAAQCDPVLFDVARRTRWQELLAAGRYGAVHVVLPKNGRNLVQRADDHPVFEQPVKLGQTFFFLLRGSLAGSVLGLEEYQGRWYPFPLGTDTLNLSVRCEAGKQPLPFNPATGQPLLLREMDHPGKHGFAFLVGPPQLIDGWGERLAPGRPVPPDSLDDLARACSELSSEACALHRVNVIFTGG